MPPVRRPARALRPERRPTTAGRLAALVALALASCSGGEPPAPPPPRVATVELAPRAATPTEEYVARIEASNTVEIRPQVDGILKQQAAVEGQRVGAGELLFLIDPDPLAAALARAKAELAQAEARLAQAQRDRERAEQLRHSNVASQQALDSAVAQQKAAAASVQAARAGVDTATLQLGYTRVVSPIDGVVGRAEVRVGAAVTAYDTLMTTVYANDPMYVDFAIDERRMLEMQREFGAALGERRPEFRIRLADGSEYPHPGVLDFVDSALDARTGTLPMRLRVPNPDGLLRANQFARVVLPTQSLAAALLVPVRAVQEFQGTHSVWIVDAEGHAQQKDVELGARVGDEWIVRSGLAAGDRVVVDGVQKLRPGIAVRGEPMPSVAAEGHERPDGS